MDTNTYTLISKFKNHGETMVIVEIKGKATCVMSERDYNRIIETERKFRKNKWTAA